MCHYLLSFILLFLICGKLMVILFMHEHRVSLQQKFHGQLCFTHRFFTYRIFALARVYYPMLACSRFVCALSTLLFIQAKCNDLRAAYAILDRMQEQGVAANVATYTSLLTGIFQNAPRDQCFNQANEVEKKEIKGGGVQK
jgi:hypothetical protein